MSRVFGEIIFHFFAPPKTSFWYETRFSHDRKQIVATQRCKKFSHPFRNLSESRLLHRISFENLSRAPNFLLLYHRLLGSMPPSRKRGAIKSYALKKRYLGLTIADSRRANKLFRILRRLYQAYTAFVFDPMRDIIWGLITVLALRYYKITRESLAQPVPILRLNRTIASFEETGVNTMFRFRSKDQLVTLFNLLQVPRVFRFIDEEKKKNHGRVSGEEAFLISLARISSTKRLSDGFHT